MISKRTRKKGGGLVSSLKKTFETIADNPEESRLGRMVKKIAENPEKSRLGRMAFSVAKEASKHSKTTRTKVGKVSEKLIEKYLSNDQIDKFKKLTDTIDQFKTLADTKKIAEFIAFLYKNINTITTLSEKLMPLIGPGKKINFEQIKNKVLKIIEKLSDEELELLKKIFFRLDKIYINLINIGTYKQFQAMSQVIKKMESYPFLKQFNKGQLPDYFQNAIDVKDMIESFSSLKESAKLLKNVESMMGKEEKDITLKQFRNFLKTNYKTYVKILYKIPILGINNPKKKWFLRLFGKRKPEPQQLGGPRPAYPRGQPITPGAVVSNSRPISGSRPVPKGPNVQSGLRTAPRTASRTVPSVPRPVQSSPRPSRSTSTASSGSRRSSVSSPPKGQRGTQGVKRADPGTPKTDNQKPNKPKAENEKLPPKQSSQTTVLAHGQGGTNVRVKIREGKNKTGTEKGGTENGKTVSGTSQAGTVPETKNEGAKNGQSESGTGKGRPEETATDQGKNAKAGNAKAGNGKSEPEKVGPGEDNEGGPSSEQHGPGAGNGKNAEAGKNVNETDEPATGGNEGGPTSDQPGPGPGAGNGKNANAESEPVGKNPNAKPVGGNDVAENRSENVNPEPNPDTVTTPGAGIDEAGAENPGNANQPKSEGNNNENSIYEKNADRSNLNHPLFGTGGPGAENAEAEPKPVVENAVNGNGQETGEGVNNTRPDGTDQVGPVNDKNAGNGNEPANPNGAENGTGGPGSENDGAGNLNEQETGEGGNGNDVAGPEQTGNELGEGGNEPPPEQPEPDVAENAGNAGAGQEYEANNVTANAVIEQQPEPETPPGPEQQPETPPEPDVTTNVPSVNTETPPNESEAGGGGRCGKRHTKRRKNRKLKTRGKTRGKNLKKKRAKINSKRRKYRNKSRKIKTKRVKKKYM